MSAKRQPLTSIARFLRAILDGCVARTTATTSAIACDACCLTVREPLGAKRALHGARRHSLPRQPAAEDLRNMGRKFPPGHLHESWMDFLYWDAELEA